MVDSAVEFPDQGLKTRVFSQRIEVAIVIEPSR
jgi:hypothetical protein